MLSLTNPKAGLGLRVQGLGFRALNSMSSFISKPITSRFLP